MLKIFTTTIIVVLSSFSAESQDCTADFTWFENDRVAFTVQFLNDSEGDYNSYLWEFGDGNTSMQENPLHTYEVPGYYKVCINISDSAGSCTDSHCEWVFVDETPSCSADFSYFIDSSDYLTVHFTDQSLGNPTGWYWDFGEGTDPSTEQNPIVTYPMNGIRYVCLTTTDSITGSQDEICKYINVNVPGSAISDFTWYVEDTLTVNFQDASSGDIIYWSWFFGDEIMGYQQNPQHVYAEEGVYPVHLIVQESAYSADIRMQNVAVTDNLFTDAEFVFEPIPGDPYKIAFTDVTPGDAGSWLWEFGDENSSAEQNPVHTFADTGNYMVSLSVMNSTGEFSSRYIQQITVQLPDSCDTDFAYEPVPDQLFTMAFTDLTEGPVNEWAWDFGDGNNSFEQNPVHTYADTGTYLVKLVVSNEDSLQYCSDSITKNIVVTAPMPDCEASFIMHPDSGVNAPNLFHFHDATQNEPDEWLWEFGDGHTSTEQNPVHQYEEGGSYEISLTVTKYNTWGEDCTDTKTVQMETPAYFHIGGFVYTGHFPINNPEPTGDTALVYLYRYHNNNSIVSIDTSLVVENGYFHALFLLEDNYMVKYRLTEGSANASAYFPTYFGDKMRWQSAPVLSLADSSHYHVDVHLAEVPETEAGTGLIAGSVLHHSATDENTIPAKDSEILIYNSQGQAIGYVHSGKDGTFSFEALPLGTYSLIAESTGLFTDPVSVTLTETNPSVLDVRLDIYTSEVYSVGEEISASGNGIRIYPNPAINTLNVVANKQTIGPLYYEIFDFSGRLLNSGSFGTMQNAGNMTINFSPFGRGIYFLRVYSADGHFTETQKIVK